MFLCFSLRRWATQELRNDASKAWGMYRTLLTVYLSNRVRVSGICRPVCVYVCVNGWGVPVCMEMYRAPH